jgi:hypothetical protein
LFHIRCETSDASFFAGLQRHSWQKSAFAGKHSSSMSLLRFLLLWSLVPLMGFLTAITGINLSLWSADAAGEWVLYLVAWTAAAMPLSTWWFCCKVSVLPS